MMKNTELPLDKGKSLNNLSPFSIHKGVKGIACGDT